MFNFEAQKAREKIANEKEIALRWNGKRFWPNEMIDRNILTLLQEKTCFLETEIDDLLIRLSNHDLTLVTIGYEFKD